MLGGSFDSTSLSVSPAQTAPIPKAVESASPVYGLRVSRSAAAAGAARRPRSSSAPTACVA